MSLFIIVNHHILKAFNKDDVVLIRCEMLNYLYTEKTGIT